MTQEEVCDELQAKLKKATLTSLAKSGELAKLKAYIAAHLYAEITGGQKPVDPKFIPKATPSKDELDFLLSTLNKYQLTSTLKVLTLELGMTGDYSSQMQNSAHQTSESMSISPNRYQHNQSETESAQNYELENDDFGFVGQQYQYVSALPTSGQAQKGAAFDEKQKSEVKPAVVEVKIVKQEPEKSSTKEADVFNDFDDFKDLDELADLETGKKQDPEADLDNFDDLEDLDFDGKESEQKLVGSVDYSQKSLKEEPPAVSLGTRDTVGSSGKADSEQDALDNFDDLQFDEPEKKESSDKRQDKAKQAPLDEIDNEQVGSDNPAEKSTYNYAANRLTDFGDDMDNFDDLQFDEPKEAPKKDLPKATKAAVATSNYKKEQQKSKVPGYTDDLDMDNFDDLEDLDFNVQEQIKVGNESTRQAPSSIDNLPDFEDMPNLAFAESDAKKPTVKANLDDFANFDDLEDFDFDQPKKEEKASSNAKPTAVDDFNGLDDLDDFGDLPAPGKEKKESKKSKSNALDELDNFDDLDDLDFGFDEQKPPKTGKKSDFDFEDFEDL